MPLQYAIRSLLHRRQSERQIREKLAKRFPDADPEPVIERLKELNYLNDQALSEAWVNYRSMSSPRGKYTLQRELKLKGVQHDDLEKALKGYDEMALLRELAAQKWPKISAGSHSKKREKLMRFLVSRGFTISDVLQVVNSFAREEENC